MLCCVAQAEKVIVEAQQAAGEIRVATKDFINGVMTKADQIQASEDQKRQLLVADPMDQD